MGSLFCHFIVQSIIKYSLSFYQPGVKAEKDIKEYIWIKLSDDLDKLKK